MSNAWIVYGLSMDSVWIKYGKGMGKVWERYRKGMGKTWTRYQQLYEIKNIFLTVYFTLPSLGHKSRKKY